MVNTYYITFGKSRFSQNEEILAWLIMTFGNGGWYKSTISSGARWAWDQMFGNTTFYFNDRKDLTWFMLKWAHNELPDVVTEVT